MKRLDKEWDYLFQMDLDCSESTCDDVSRFDIFSTKVESTYVNVTILELWWLKGAIVPVCRIIV